MMHGRLVERATETRSERERDRATQPDNPDARHALSYAVFSVPRLVYLIVTIDAETSARK